MPTIMIQMFLKFSKAIIEINFSFLIVQNSTRTATTTSTFLKHLKITSFFHSKVAKTVSKSVEKLKTNVLENLIKSFRGIFHEGNIRDYREYLICNERITSSRPTSDFRFRFGRFSYFRHLQ